MQSMLHLTPYPSYSIICCSVVLFENCVAAVRCFCRHLQAKSRRGTHSCSASWLPQQRWVCFNGPSTCR